MKNKHIYIINWFVMMSSFNNNLIKLISVFEYKILNNVCPNAHGINECAAQIKSMVVTSILIFFWSIEPADQNSFCVFSFLRLALCLAKFTVLFRWVLYTVMCIAHFCKNWRSSLWHEWCRFCNYFKARSCLNSSKLISFDMWHSLLVRILKLGFDNNWGKSFEWK